MNVRRIPELLTRLFVPLLFLSAPILASFIITGESGHPTLYPWAVPTPQEEHGEEAVPDEADSDALDSGASAAAHEAEIEEDFIAEPTAVLTEQAITVERARHHLHYDELTATKAPFLNRPFFIARILVYFGIWIALAGYFFRRSIQQDASGEPRLTKEMTSFSYAALVIYAISLTFAAFDIVMSVDPHFFSTIFGGYIFAGGVVGFFAVTILSYQLLRRANYLKQSVTVEHYHDLGKLLFAFVFFWGYIAFSQFMLIWYANIPETTYWFAVRGATSVDANFGFGPWGAPEEPAKLGYWTVISMSLLFGHLLVPFALLLSRHVKRNLTTLGIMAGWMLTMHYVDIYWLIMPEMLIGGWQLLPVTEIGCLLLVSGVAISWMGREIKTVKLRPAGDPRAGESLAFQNM